MIEEVNQVTTDLILLVTAEGYYKEFESGSIIELTSTNPDIFHLSMILPENTVQKIRNAVINTLQTGTVHMVSYSLTIGENEEMYNAKVIPMHSEQAMLLVQNVTELHNYRIKLDRKNTLLSTVLQNIVAQVMVFDNDGNLILTNKSGDDEYIPSTIAEANQYGVNFLKCDGKTYYKQEELPLSRALIGEEVVNQIVVKKVKEFSFKTFLVNAAPLKGQGGAQEGIVLTARDISDLETSRSRLKSKVKDLDTFMYRASHDLKSPLLSMKGILDFASTKLQDPETQTYLGLLKKSHAHLFNIVDDLINLTRISRKEIQKTEVDLNLFIENMLNTLRLMPQAGGIKLKAFVPERLRTVLDEGLLRATLQNLISNAILHHHQEGEGRYVFVMVYDRKDNILIEVVDNGIGIEKSMQEKVYDVFFRGNPKAAGTGLGLYIVKEAVEKMGGNIDMVSEKGAGTTFGLILPKVIAE